MYDVLKSSFPFEDKTKFDINIWAKYLENWQPKNRTKK